MAKIAEKNSRKVREAVQKEKELQAAMSPLETKKMVSSLAFSDDEWLNLEIRYKLISLK